MSSGQQQLGSHLHLPQHCGSFGEANCRDRWQRNVNGTRDVDSI